MTALMTAALLVIPLLSAVLGALAAGLANTVLDWSSRSRNREAILKAFAAEVGLIAWIVRHQYHPVRWRQIADRVEAGEAVRLALDLSQDYFTMYRTLSHDIGRLKASEAFAIIRFYSICRIVIDTVGLQSVYSTSPQNMRFAAGMIEYALKLSDRIAELPKDQKIEDDLGPPHDWSSSVAPA